MRTSLKSILKKMVLVGMLALGVTAASAQCLMRVATLRDANGNCLVVCWSWACDDGTSGGFCDRCVTADLKGDETLSTLTGGDHDISSALNSLQ